MGKKWRAATYLFSKNRRNSTDRNADYRKAIRACRNAEVFSIRCKPKRKEGNERIPTAEFDEYKKDGRQTQTKAARERETNAGNCTVQKEGYKGIRIRK